jgi:oxepin-CoA hydrolase/3-oxo-5,6-dehydrosuberyl-CoA semialdehyde dehydrogenase
MNLLPNYALGQWTKPTGDKEIPQYDAITGDLISIASSGGLDFAEMMDYARKVGNSKLRKMTFHERGMMLKKLALFLHDKFLGRYRRRNWKFICECKFKKKIS